MGCWGIRISFGGFYYDKFFILKINIYLWTKEEDFYWGNVRNYGKYEILNLIFNENFYFLFFL